jgi:hypothetical protein
MIIMLEKKTLFGVELQQFYFHNPIFSEMISQSTLHGGNTIIRPTTIATVGQHERRKHLAGNPRHMLRINLL